MATRRILTASDVLDLLDEVDDSASEGGESIASVEDLAACYGKKSSG